VLRERDGELAALDVVLDGGGVVARQLFERDLAAADPERLDGSLAGGWPAGRGLP
jgi:hypothetical protein